MIPQLISGKSNLQTTRGRFASLTFLSKGKFEQHINFHEFIIWDPKAFQYRILVKSAKIADFY